MSGSVLWPVLAAACCIAILCWALRVRQQNLQITAAVNNMSQGLCMFDSAARLVFANKRYLEIYRLSAETTKPGCTLHDLVKNRQAAGTFSGDVDKYVSNLLNEIATGKAVDKLIELKDGRVIALCNRLMRGGGWVVTHDDITAQRSAEQKHAELAGQEQRRVQVEAAISAFRQRIEAVLGTLAGSAGAIRSTATTLSSASDQTSQRAEGAVKTSNDASGNVEAAADAADELLRSITEIARQLEQTTGLVRVAVTEAQTTNNEIAGLAHAAQKIGDVVKLIQDIAGQTNLLALNATIEAARAGESGKGFAVVAAEVKSLAVQTAKATEEIGAQISAVQSSTTGAVEAIRRIAGRMQEINEFASTVSAAVQEQSTATGEISHNVTNAAKGAKVIVSILGEVAGAATDTRHSAQTVLSASESVETAAANLRTEVESFLGKVAM
ncbi:MAG: methyl-accepting chemotaxis protein [Xanthobacteraceae bacterium]